MDAQTTEQEADMPTEVLTTDAEETSEFHLEGFHECDANATGSERASVRVWVGDIALHFCAHHARKNLEALMTAGYRIEAPEGVLSF